MTGMALLPSFSVVDRHFPFAVYVLMCVLVVKPHPTRSSACFLPRFSFACVCLLVCTRFRSFRV